MLDGAARIDDVVDVAAADGQPGVGITDHGVLYGAVDFVKATRSRGLKPVIGIEAYFTDGSRFDRPAGIANQRYHLLLFAENQVGYRNLMKLSSRAFLEGYYYKPRMDFELLAEHSEGVIATSGCLGGLVPQLLGPDFDMEERARARPATSMPPWPPPADSRTSSGGTTSSSSSRITVSRGSVESWPT